MKRLLSFFLGALMISAILLPAAGCGSKDNSVGTYPVSVAGVTIESQPQVIACLSVNYSEVITDIGYAHLLDGRPGNCDLPELLSAAPCGTADKPSVDAILNLGTDLLIVDTVTPLDVLYQLADQGVTILQLVEPTTRTGFLNLYRCIGTAMNGNGRGYDDGEAAAQAILTELDSIERAIMFEEPVNVCLFTKENLTESITGDMLASYLIEIAGGFNVSIESTGGYCDMETVIFSSPDVILCPIGAENKVRSQRDLDDCGAMQTNRIYGYDTSKFNSLGSDLVLAAWELAHLFHPTVITSEDLPFGAVDYYPNYDGVVIVTTEEEYEQMMAEQEAQKENGN